ncbi:uncharacterized protein [Magallana gigas]|uniref:uncharacterized protein isoform X5 n=1 Tax=Magallana gigas TaxID=29159 RepID=UPI003340517A
MAGIYFSDLSGRLDESQPPAYDTLFERQSASSREQADTPSNTHQRAYDSLYRRQFALLHIDQGTRTSHTHQRMTRKILLQMIFSYHPPNLSQGIQLPHLPLTIFIPNPCQSIHQPHLPHTCIIILPNLPQII